MFSIIRYFLVGRSYIESLSFPTKHPQASQEVVQAPSPSQAPEATAFSECPGHLVHTRPTSFKNLQKRVTSQGQGSCTESTVYSHGVAARNAHLFIWILLRKLLGLRAPAWACMLAWMTSGTLALTQPRRAPLYNLYTIIYLFYRNIDRTELNKSSSVSLLFL